MDSQNGTTNYTTDIGNRYTSADGATFTYDTAGRLITRTTGGVTMSYSYDYNGLLIGQTSPGNVVAYQYDALGLRIGRTVNGVHTDFAIDPAGYGTVFGEYQGATSTNYVNGLGIAARATGGSNAYYHFDAVGNTAYLSGAAGASVASYTYLPFGEIASQSGAIAQPFTFNGLLGVQSDGNNLYNMRARTYDAGLGRFSTRDPIGFGGGDTNTYRYAENNPVNLSDPSGLLGYYGAYSLASRLFRVFGEVEAAATTLGYIFPARYAEIIPATYVPASTTPAVTAYPSGMTVTGAGAQAVVTPAAPAVNLAGTGGAVGTAEGEAVVGEGLFAEGASAAVLPAALGGVVLFGFEAAAIDGGQTLFSGITKPQIQDVLGDKNNNFTPNKGASELFNDLFKVSKDMGKTDGQALLDAIEFLRKFGIYDPIYNPNPKTSNIGRPRARCDLLARLDLK